MLRNTIFPNTEETRYRYSGIYILRKAKSTFSRIPNWLDIQIDIQIRIWVSTYLKRRSHNFFRIPTLFDIQILVFAFYMRKKKSPFSRLLTWLNFKSTYKSVFSINKLRKTKSPFSLILIWLDIQIGIRVSTYMYLKRRNHPSRIPTSVDIRIGIHVSTC